MNIPASCLVGLFSVMLASPPAAAAPNIVIFFSDDHAQQAISAYQNLPTPTAQDLVFKNWAPAQTPNIDRLASQGAIFTNSYVSNSICQPSRANLLTGLHSHANGQLANAANFNASQQTFPKLLQTAGYSTALIGKWHLGDSPSALPKGFDQFEILVGQGEYYSPQVITSQPGGGTSTISYPGQYVADVVTNRAVVWLQGRINGGQTNPFLLMVNHKGTHRVWSPAPAETDPAVFRQVEWNYAVTPNPNTDPTNPQNWTPATVPVPANFNDDLNGYPSRASSADEQEMEIESIMRVNADLKLTGSTFGGTAYAEVRTWWEAHKNSLTTAEKRAYYLQRYLKDYMLTGKSVDRSVGNVLDFLEANQLDRNTIIIYASDQGFFLGEHGWFDKRWMYEESLRTPLLMQWKDAAGNPKIAPGSQVGRMVQVLDYAPTLLSAAGVTGYTPMHGESFLDTVTAAPGDNPANWRDAIYYHYYEGYSGEHRVGRHYGVRTSRYKLIYQYERAGKWELFDLATDPTEMNNLLYNASTGVIDDPTDGVDGTPTFQNLVTDLMLRLRSLRTQYNDATGPTFSIPGIDLPELPDPDLLLDLLPGNAGYDALVSRYTFAANNGNDSVGTNHLTTTGTVTYVTAGVPAGLGQAAQVANNPVTNGAAASYLSMTTGLQNGNYSLSNFSVSFWFNQNVAMLPSGNPGANTIFALSGAAGAATNTQIQTSFYGSNNPADEVKTHMLVGGSQTTATGRVDVNTWHHVAIVGGAGAINYFFDGAAAGSISVTPTAGPLDELFLFRGGNFDSGSLRGWNGQIADVQLYDQNLTAGQVTSLFTNPGSAVPEPSVALLGGLGVLGLLRRRRH